MPSSYLRRLKPHERSKLRSILSKIQKNKCFICSEEFECDLNSSDLNVDHVVPTSRGGVGGPANFALTHASCNKSKQDSDLNVARSLHQYDKLVEKVREKDRGPNLDDILKKHKGAKYDIRIKKDNRDISYALPEMGKNSFIRLPLYEDKLSGFKYFFANLPIEYLHHDEKINPRSIGSSLPKLIKEFNQKRPQLHISLAWVNIPDRPSEGSSKVRIFDGQHKAAAQIMLGAKEFPVRIFVDPNKELLLTTNTNAGTTLRQVAFDKSVQRHIGSSQYSHLIAKYKEDLNLKEDDESFTEKTIVNHFKGQKKQTKKFILDAIRDSIIHDPKNKLKPYVDLGGRNTEKPLSYSAIDKTFYSLFLYQGILESPLNDKAEEGENPRMLEVEQMVSLMNIIAEEVYIDKFDFDIGANKIENRIQSNDPDIPGSHLCAFRVSREEILRSWLPFIKDMIYVNLIMKAKMVDKNIFHYRLEQTVWDSVRKLVRNFVAMPVWVNHELSGTVFGAKQTYQYWKTTFEKGTTPSGVIVLVEPINWRKLIE